MNVKNIVQNICFFISVSNKDIFLLHYSFNTFTTMKKSQKNIFGFQYWYNGSKLQTGTHFHGESLNFGREMHRQYVADGNTIASWFEGTVKECNAFFGRDNW